MTALNPRFEGMVAHARQRKQDSRERLLAAFLDLICDRGYADVPVEEILVAAGVGRATFYRHFRSKGELTVALYNKLIDASMPRFLAIRDRDFRDAKVVSDWIVSLFEADRAKKRRHEVFALAAAQTPELAEPARQTIRTLIAGLGTRIPAFALDPDVARDRERWLEAWLLLFEILDQSNQAALGTGEAGDPLIVVIMAKRFLAFVHPDCL